MRKVTIFFIVLALICFPQVHADTLKTGLIDFWNADTTNQTANAISTGTNLSAINTPSVTTAGKVGNGYNITGVNHYYYTNDTNIPTSFNNRSMCYWTNLITPGGVGHNDFMISYGGSTSQAAFGGYLLPSSHRGVFYASVTDFQFNSTSDTNAGVFNYYCHVYNGTHVANYFNGLINTVSPTVLGTTTNTLLRFGNSVLVSGGTDGIIVIDEVGIWNRTLSSAEVSQLYGGGSGLPFSQFGAVNLSWGSFAQNITQNWNVSTNFTLNATNLTVSCTVSTYYSNDSNFRPNASGFVNWTANISKQGYHAVQFSVNDTCADNISQVTIINLTYNPFNLTAIMITPSPTGTTNPLVCALTINNTDGASITNTTRWYVNGTIKPSLENVTSVAVGNLSLGANWTCSALLTDSITTIGFTNSSTLTLGDAIAPVINSFTVSASPTVGTASETILMNCTDNQQVGSVIAQVTDPNTITNNVSLTLSSGNLYSLSYTPNTAGTYNVTGFCIDGSQNTNRTSPPLQFTAVTAPPPPPPSPGGGGGGGPPNAAVSALTNQTVFTVRTGPGGSTYDLTFEQGENRTLTLDLTSLLPSDVLSIDVSCDQPSDFQLCNYVSYSTTNVVLNAMQTREITMTVNLPQSYVYGSQLSFNTNFVSAATHARGVILTNILVSRQSYLRLWLLNWVAVYELGSFGVLKFLVWILLSLLVTFLVRLVFHSAKDSTKNVVGTLVFFVVFFVLSIVL